MSSYSALIRTFNSEQTLAATLRSLSEQSAPPSQYIFVDSGSRDATFSLLPEGAIVHRFVGEKFNYSAALNQGIAHVSCDKVLIISSHTALSDPGAIRYALDLLDRDETIGAAYFDNERKPLTHQRIDRSNFNGFNGVWNTCALLRTDLVRSRPFRPEVFSAEDQEWSNWLVHTRALAVARISGAGMSNAANPNISDKLMLKQLNEHVAIAYYTNRKMLSLIGLAKIALHIVKPIPPFSLKTRIFYFLLLIRLVACRFAEPQPKSTYF
jgi:glycosyltransferase involved in cell wall biosynthesis